MSPHGPNVTSLTLTRQPESGLADLFTGLEEFVIAGPFWSSPLPTLPKTLMHIRLQVHAFMSDSLLPAITTEVQSLSNLCLVSVEEALTTDKHYPCFQEACRAHGVDILVNPIDSSQTGTVVSKPEELPGLKTLNVGYALISIPILPRWIAFHGSIHLRSSSVSNVEFRRLWMSGVMRASSWQWLSTSCKGTEAGNRETPICTSFSSRGSRHPICHKISHGSRRRVM